MTRSQSMLLQRRALLATFAAAMALAAAPAAHGQQFPSKPIRIVVTAPAGGTADIVARTLAEGLTAQLGQSVLVDNKPGGLGAIGLQDLLTAPRDGYTIMVSANAVVSEVPHVVRQRIDPFKELKPLAELTRSALVMVGGPSVPATNLKEVIAYVKANPGKVSYASYSTGTLSHTMGLELNKAAGLDLRHVGYKGSPPALQDVVGGHVALMFDGPATSIPMIKAGKLKAFAVSSPKRLGALPEVPTFAELGYPQINSVGWVGLWVTPDVPAAVQARLREATLKVLQQPRVAERFTDLGQDVGLPLTPEELSRSLRAASDKHAALLKSIGFQPE
ncbi:MAG TPA: tripartite tricarboxylate transporter substrate binding protein [Ramlibacter sp.]|nr:tripartite tricarboxylate transporter substrate binding protein [Ramlibacter sp.]